MHHATGVSRIESTHDVENRETLRGRLREHFDGARSAAQAELVAVTPELP
jgi:hypothetical protein